MQLRLVRAAACLIIASVFFTAHVSGQTSQGSIGGTVTDSTGAVVAGAQVVARNAQTGATSETVTSSAGTYSFPNLNPGNYDLTVTFAGFKAVHQNAVIVQVGTTSAQNITLQPGEV